MIIEATLAYAQSLQSLLEQTILRTYPFYYAKGAVDFFICRHNLSEIQSDIMKSQVYVYEINDEIVGSVTVKHDEIYRLFVIPKFQHCGYGTQLLLFAEKILAESGVLLRLDASLPSKEFFLKHGYKEKAYRKVQLDTGDFYCYDVMTKKEINPIEVYPVEEMKRSVHMIENMK